MKEPQEAQTQRGPAVHAAPAGAGESRRDRLAAEVQALSRLNAVSSNLWRASDLEHGLQEILSASITLLGGDKGIVQLLREDGVLRLIAQQGFDDAFIDFLREVAPEDCASCARALETGQRVIVEDVDADELCAPLRKAAKAAGYRALQSTPILSRDGRRLGVLSTYHRAPHRPDEQALRLLDLYAQQAADFVDRCTAEQQLRETDQRLKALSDIAPGAILWGTTPSGGCSFITRGWLEYTGQSAEQALGFGWLEPVHADSRERARRIFDDAAVRREPFVLDYKLRRADGEYRWVLAAGRPRYDDGGRFLGFVGSVIDAHERKLAENALRESEAILAGQKEAFQWAMDGKPLPACLNALVRTAVAHFGDARAAFYMLRSEGPAALQHVVGMGEEYARHVDDFKIGPESLACGLVSHKVEQIISSDVERDLRWEPWQWLARMHRYRACWLFPIQAVGGPVLGTFALYFREPRTPTVEELNVASALERAAALVIAQYREIAERARADLAMKEASRRKDEFLAVLGHELRNPLAPLSMATDLLQKADASREVLETVGPIMRRQIDHLTRLVNDLLDITRISRGRAELQQAQLDLRRAIEDAVEQCRPLMAERQHTLTVALGAKPLLMEGDFQRLTQVFGNLLTNAAKYSTKCGAVTVRAVQQGDAAVVHVKDRGFGIPKERLRDLFEMFSQVPEHRPLVDGGGLGIGLALCRQLAELHGGSIDVQSEGLGRGSEFIVRLPLTAVARYQAQTPAPTPAGTRRRRVLVVDDNADAAETLRMTLELQGHEAHAAYTGAAALEAMTQFDADVVLLDLGMPQMDGFEVAGRIRAMPHGRDVLLVALTGWGQPDDRRRTADAGFDEHLTKPIDPEHLAAMLAGDIG